MYTSSVSGKTLDRNTSDDTDVDPLLATTVSVCFFAPAMYQHLQSALRSALSATTKDPSFMITNPPVDWVLP